MMVGSNGGRRKWRLIRELTGVIHPSFYQVHCWGATGLLGPQ